MTAAALATADVQRFMSPGHCVTTWKPEVLMRMPSRMHMYEPFTACTWNELAVDHRTTNPLELPVQG